MDIGTDWHVVVNIDEQYGKFHSPSEFVYFLN